MDQHFSIDIAKYNKSNNIVVGFDLFQPLFDRGTLYKKVYGTIVAHADPEIRDGEPYIGSFNVVINSNKEAYKNCRSEEEKYMFISVIETENIISYELATIKAAIPKWSKSAGLTRVR